jgi:hypothetical protein
MNCDHCGKTVNSNAKFCGKCGAFLNFSKKIQAESVQGPVPLAAMLVGTALPVLEAADTSRFELEHVSSVESPAFENAESSQNTAFGDSDDLHASIVQSEAQGTPAVIVAALEEHDFEHKHSAHQDFQHPLTVEPSAAPLDNPYESSNHFPQVPLNQEELNSSHPKPDEEQAEQVYSVDKNNPEHLELTENTQHVEHQESHNLIGNQADQIAVLKLNTDHSEQSLVADTVGTAGELMNIRHLSPILKDQISLIGSEFSANFENLQVSMNKIRQELDEKVAHLKADAHATAQALAQRIYLTQQANAATSPDNLSLQTQLEQLRAEFVGELGKLNEQFSAVEKSTINKNPDEIQALVNSQFLGEFGELKEQLGASVQALILKNAEDMQAIMNAQFAGKFGDLKEQMAVNAQALVSKNAEEMQTLMSVEFKKIQTGIVNLYNTQQNTIVKNNEVFEEALTGLTYKIQSIESFLTSQTSNSSQSESSASSTNRSIAVAINDIRGQLQEQQELLSGLTIDPALIKTMNSFNINFRKQQELLASSNQKAGAQSKSKLGDTISISDTVVMWFVGFLCGLTILLGGFSIYNYSTAQEVKAELKHKKSEESLKLKENSQASENHESGKHAEGKSEKAEKTEKNDLKSSAHSEHEEKAGENAAGKGGEQKGEKETEKLAEKAGEKGASEKGAEKGSEKGSEKGAEKEAPKKPHSSSKE